MESRLASESPLAICFFELENDTNNQCILTENFLSFTRKGKIATFALDDINSLSFSARKLMLPLITGGIFGPLSVIAISKNIFNPWGILIWLMINLLLIYYGWIGYVAITVNLKGFHRDFPIRTKSSNLIAFTAFVNEYIINKKKKLAETIPPIYHILEARVWEKVKESSSYSPDSLSKEGFIHLCDKSQIARVLERYYKNKSNLILLHIDPVKLRNELKYEQVYDNEALYPHLYGPLNLSAIKKAEPLLD